MDITFPAACQAILWTKFKAPIGRSRGSNWQEPPRRTQGDPLSIQGQTLFPSDVAGPGNGIGGKADHPPHGTRPIIPGVATSRLALAKIRLQGRLEWSAQRIARNPGRIHNRSELARNHGAVCHGGFRPNSPRRRSHQQRERPSRFWAGNANHQAAAQQASRRNPEKALPMQEGLPPLAQARTSQSGAYAAS